MKRIVTALILAPLITWVVIWAPFLAFAFVISTVAALCYWEFCGIAAGHGIDIPRLPGIVAGVALLFAPSDLTFAVLLAIAALLSGLRADNLRDSLPRASVLLLGMIYIFGCWHTAVSLRAINPFWLFFGLALNWVGDTAAMYGGRAFGRHKLAPRVSPAKSWEGSIASILGTLAFGAAFAYWAMPAEPLWKVELAATLGNIAGQVGDLCESAFKRGAGMKDSGTLLPGHGGWLDRVDSSLFSIPVVYAIVRIWSA